jgi:hypothetical protein
MEPKDKKLTQGGWKNDQREKDMYYRYPCSNGNGWEHFLRTTGK